MFGSKGFSNPLGDDILNSFITDTAKKSQKPLTESDEKHLLATKKLVQQLAEEEEGTRSPPARTTNSIALSSIPKKKSPKPNDDDIDDLLDLIDDAKGAKPANKKPLEPTKSSLKSPPKVTATPPKAEAHKPTTSTVSNKFAEELSDDDLDIPSSYDPTARNSATKRPTFASQDLSKKKEALFGLSNSALTNMNNKTQSSDMQNSQLKDKPQQRPQTMETKAQKDDDEFGDINIGFSRRKNQGSAGKKRPTEEPKPAPVQDNKTLSLSPGRLSTTIKAGKDADLDGEEEEESKYLSSFMNKDKKDQKSTFGGSRLGDNQKLSMGRLNTLSNTAEITTPVKSPRSEFTASKEGFFQNKEPLLYLPQAGGNDKKDDSSIPRNPIGILGKKDLLDPFGSQLQQQQQQQQSQLTMPGKSISTLGNSAVRKEKVDGFGSRSDNLQGSAVSGVSGEVISIHNVPAGIKDEGLKVYLRETEEYYKKRAKESEEYYENRYKGLKRAVDEEKAKWEEIHEKELQLVKKENKDLKENMNKHLERERERMKEMFELEIESKEKIHKYELQRQLNQFEEENHSLKKQLEAQIKLNALADEIKNSSNKLVSLSDKIEHGKAGGIFGAKGELREKEKELEDLEKKLKHELEIVNDEKKRIDKIRMEVDSRERQDRESLEKERGVLRQEYARLNELQDSVRKQEVEKMRNLEKEKTLYQMEREKLERESLRTKEEYSRKYHELEVEVELHSIKKKEFDRVLEKTEMDFLKKQEEMEATMKRLSAIETDLMGRVRELEHKEMMVRKSAEEVQRRLDLLELDRITFEKERSHVIKMADKARDDNEQLTRFRQDFEDEQDKNVLLRSELAAFAASLNNEKKQLAEERNNFANMSKALEAIKHDYVKEIDLGQRTALKETNRPPRERSQDSVMEKAPFTYVASPGSTAQKNPRGRENKYDTGFSLHPPVYPQNDRLVRLKDLRDGVTEPRPSEPKRIEDNNHAFRKMMHNSDGFQNWAKSTTHTEAKIQKSDKFDYNNYMTQLKQFDRTSAQNQSYIEMEREDLIYKKITPSSGYSPLKKPYSLTSKSRSEKFSSPM